MELQFDKSMCKSLHKVLNDVLDQELTQEIRVPEPLPDIGRILGCWGQIILRGKEWYNGSAGVSGGIMAWVLYVPDDGSFVRSVDTWIPFQMKWDIPESQRDGVVYTIPLLKSVDARSVSARKIMVRANVSVQAQAYETRETAHYHADQLPEDVQVLNQTYHLDVPVEAGEKVLQIEDQLQISGYEQNKTTICYYDLRPEMTESRILGDKLLFRGTAIIRVMYCTDDHALQTLKKELSFSQYTHLDETYHADVTAWTYPVVTGLELDFSGEQPMVKASLAVQYVICEPKEMEITEDVYSITRNIVSEQSTLSLLSKLDILTEDFVLNHKIPIQAREIVDIVCYPSHAQKIQNGDIIVVEQPVVFQILYMDTEGNLQSSVTLSKFSWEFASDTKNDVDVEVVSISGLQSLISSDEVLLTLNMLLKARVCSENGLPMTHKITFKDEKELDPSRPSLIVRKLGSNSVWDIAKQYGAKISDIKVANQSDFDDSLNQIVLVQMP